MDIDKEYKVFLYDSNNKLIGFSKPLTMQNAIIYALLKLQNINSIDCDYEFIETYDKFRDNVLCKRFVLKSLFPYTTILIKKLTTGSIPKDSFLATYEYLKGGFKNY